MVGNCLKKNIDFKSKYMSLVFFKYEKQSEQISLTDENLDFLLEVLIYFVLFFIYLVIIIIFLYNSLLTFLHSHPHSLQL